MTIRSRVYEEHQRKLEEEQVSNAGTRSAPEIVQKKSVLIIIRRIV